MQQDDEIGTNPYLALRAAKIARNEDRLKQLGLWKPVLSKQHLSSPRLKRKQTSSSHSALSTLRKKEKVALVAPRRSARLSRIDNLPNYVESNLDDPREALYRNKSSSVNASGDEMEDSNKGLSQNDISVAKIPRAPFITSVTPKYNSVRLLSLNITKLVSKFLGKPMTDTGKEFVIREAFREAFASTKQFQRLEGVKLSFNKYSGVQLWKNVAFLWVNIGGCNISVVNDFLQDGRLVTWFGGSKMVEGSPVIQTLMDLGKQVASKSSVQDSGIVLWCRRFVSESNKFGSYVCLGRLSYHSHVPNSYPVAFTWQLLEYKDLMNSQESREVFRGIVNS
jgi:hypothetical protein